MLPKIVVTRPISSSDRPQVASMVSIMPAVQEADHAALDDHPDDRRPTTGATTSIAIQMLTPAFVAVMAA